MFDRYSRSILQSYKGLKSLFWLGTIFTVGDFLWSKRKPLGKLVMLIPWYGWIGIWAGIFACGLSRSGIYSLEVFLKAQIKRAKWIHDMDELVKVSDRVGQILDGILKRDTQNHCAMFVAESIKGSFQFEFLNSPRTPDALNKAVSNYVVALKDVLKRIEDDKITDDDLSSEYVQGGWKQYRKMRLL